MSSFKEFLNEKEMSYDEAISVLNLSKGKTKEEYAEIAKNTFGRMTKNAPLKDKVACKVLMKI